MVDIISKEKRSWNMSRIAGKNTKPEVLLRSLLHRQGFRFRLHGKHLPGKPDIVLPRYRAVIFVNGCFWHRHKNCKYAYTPKSRQEFWLNKFEATIQRDRKEQEILGNMGWQVLVVWECELKKDSELLISDIHTRLLEHSRAN
jgi:DNA mismatch endonuclease (patch repair protein)